MLAQVAAARPSLFVVAEAHCVSSWGHDVRPDYLRLGSIVAQLGHPPVLALTATAPPPIREEIVERLGMRDAVQVVHGFDRPDLSIEVVAVRDDDRRRDEVVLRAMGSPKPGIVYTATRRFADSYAEALQGLGAEAAAYHAGTRAADRADVQNRFMAGDLDVVVATTAFGMGIDKADVRFVIHAEVADSLDSWYQEVGAPVGTANRPRPCCSTGRPAPAVRPPPPDPDMSPFPLQSTVQHAAWGPASSCGTKATGSWCCSSRRATRRWCWPR